MTSKFDILNGECVCVCMYICVRAHVCVCMYVCINLFIVECSVTENAFNSLIQYIYIHCIKTLNLEKFVACV